MSFVCYALQREDEINEQTLSEDYISLEEYVDSIDLYDAQPIVQDDTVNFLDL